MANAQDHANHELVRRIGAAMQDDLELVMNGHLLSAQVVLSPGEVAFLLLKTASNVMRGAMLYMLQTKLDEPTLDEVCDGAERAFAELVKNGRPQVMAKFVELTATQPHAR
ncbi:hypothetical protein [Sphingomonas sp. 2378]|uniref:hypothetical protein n=1 Tax=Sphingomonas sp. 2378 TaxID=1219748 RepID=UPI00311ADF28